MIPPVVAGLINYLEPLLAAEFATAQASIWDGEVPRWDVLGNAVGPSNLAGSWPAVGLEIQEPGFDVKYAIGANTTKHQGMILVQIWSTSRATTEDLMTFIEEQLNKQVSMFLEVDLNGPTDNPNYVIESLLKKWWSGQDKNYRTSTSALLYRGDMYFEVKVHSNSPTIS